jgi:hypothetical protein
MNEFNPKDIKYGLIVIDSTQEGEMFDILHFCGYWNQPKKVDADSLLEELSTDPEFGLTEIADRLEIRIAPDWLVAEYINKI